MNYVFSQIVTIILLIIIISFGTGMIIGGPRDGIGIVSWEFKQLSKFVRWILKKVFLAISDLCQWIQRQI